MPKIDERIVALEAKLKQLKVQHQRKEHRDAHIDSGMEGGMNEAFDHLEQVAQSLR